MQFNVRIFNAATGAIEQKTVDGESADAISAALRGQGLAVLDVASAARPRALLGRVAQSFDIMLFCDELRTLLASGMSLVEAIDTLCEKEPPGYKHSVLQDIRLRLLEGKPLSSALELCRYAFSPLLVASIRASERSSRVEEALDEYVAYEKVGRELRKRIVNAAIYPLLVAGFGFLVCLFMLSYVVPRFARVYEDFAQSVSWPTQVLIGVAGFLDRYLLLVLAGLLAMVGLLLAAHRRGKLMPAILWLLGTFRLIRRYLRIYQLSRLYQTMSMLLKGGFTLSDAIPLARNLALDAGLRGQIEAAHGRIGEGQRLSKAFADSGLTDTVTLRLLQVGERSGNLSHVLAMIAQGYRQDFTLFVERATRVAEPLILMLVGVLIGAIIILMYMPVFDLAGGM